jgi:HEAT repeat protein
MSAYSVRPFLVAVLCALTCSGVARDGWAQSTGGPTARANALSRAWSAIAEQKYSAAEQIAEQLLKQAATDHVALMVRIAARAEAGNPSTALDAYEEWLQRSRREDLFLLEPVAVATLAALAGSADQGIVSASLIRLARYDPGRARLLLPRGPTRSPALDGAAAALGDPEAIARLSKALSSSTPPIKMLALSQMSNVPSIDSAMLVPLLSDPAPPVRAEAAKALAARAGSQAIDRLRPLLQDPDGFVRVSAAVALAQLGDGDATRALMQMMESPAGDTAAMAATVLKQKGVDVSAVAERVLRDENPLTRLSAIPLIQTSDPARALDLLRQAARDSNPVIRSRTAEVLEHIGVEDLAVLRTLLRDESAEVRMHAASSLLRLAGTR